jgi:hypothetical protein
LALHAFHGDFGSFPVGNVAADWTRNFPGGFWAFQARLLPYLESKDIYNLCNFSYQGNCFDWAALQPIGRNPNVMLPNFSNCPDDPLKGVLYTDPAFGSYGCTSYLGVMGTTPTANDGILLHSGYDGAINLAMVTDGASHTLIVGERGISQLLLGWPYCGAGELVFIPASPYFVNTGNGDNLMATNLGLSPGTDDGNHDFHFWSYHPHLAQFILADGSAAPISYDIDFATFQALSTRAGGETAQVPEN